MGPHVGITDKEDRYSGEFSLTLLKRTGFLLLHLHKPGHKQHCENRRFLVLGKSPFHF